MSAIEWTEETWNPTTGCDRVSPGCDHCYALTMAGRLKAMGQPKYQRDGDPRTSGPGFGLTVHPDVVDVPLRRRKPTTYFVNSMSDLFHPAVPELFIADVWTTMARTPQHTYQVLTKRPKRASRLVGGLRGYVETLLWGTPTPIEWETEEYPVGLDLWPDGWLANVWLGTSIESDRYAFRADHLRATPAAVRFLSLEPLLGPLPSLDLTGIDWVIVGGESGPGARPMHPDWVRNIRDRCVAAGVPFFFKQWGGWVPYEIDAQPPFLASQHGDLFDGHYMPPDISDHRETRGWLWVGDITDGSVDTTVYRRVGKRAAGRVLDGRTWDEMPRRVG